MHFDTLMLLFPVILGIHNYEESRRLDEFVATYHVRSGKRLMQRPIVVAAFIVLTGMAAVVALLTFWSGTAALREISRIAVFSLMLNAVGHCGLSCLRRKLVPGTISAAALVLPFSVVAIDAMHADLGDTLGVLAAYVVAGAAAMPVFVLVGWLGGFLYSKLAAQVQPSRVA